MRCRQLLIIIVLFLAAAVSQATEAPARILSESVRIHVDKDGKLTRHVRQKIQLNSFSTFRTFGEWFHTYNPELETVRVIQSVTIQQDGTRVPMPENAMLDQTPYAADHAPDFSHIRERMVSHTGLEPGCTVSFEYEIVDRKPHRATWLEPMGGVFPVDEKTVTIICDGEFQIIPNGAVHALRAGEYMVRDVPSIRGHAPFTAVDTAPGILIVIRQPERLVLDTIQAATSTNPPEAVWAELGCSKETPAPDVARRLGHLLRDSLDQVDLHPDLVNWTVRPLDRVIASGYATNLERAALAAAVLHATGVRPQVFVTDDSWQDRMSGQQPEVFVSCQWDTFPEPFGYPATAWALENNAARLRPVSGSLTVTVDVTMGPDRKVTGTITASTRGTGGKQRLSSLIPISGLTVDKEQVIRQTTDEWTATGQVAGSFSDGHFSLSDAPLRPIHSADLFRATLDATHVVIPGSVDAVMTWTIRGIDAEGWALPTGTSTETDAGIGSCSWRRKGDIIQGRAVLHLKAGVYSGKKLERLRRTLAPVTHLSGQAAVMLLD